MQTEAQEKSTVAEIILLPSIGSRFARLIVLSESKKDIWKIIDGIEILSELGVFNPHDQFWPLLTKLVEKKVAYLDAMKKHVHKQGQTS